MPNNSLAGKHIAITGGARGIGAATARALVARGAAVSIGDVQTELAEATASAINETTPDRLSCVSFELDVTNEASFTDFFKHAEAELGPVDVLVNNAGIMPVGRFTEETGTASHKQVEINILGVVIGTQAALAAFADRGVGQVINISSVAGKFPLPGIAVYSGTKHFVYGFTEALRGEYRGTGISFTTVLPNIAHTELGKGVTGIKFITKSTPEDIATNIVKAIEKPQRYVWVPRYLEQLSGIAAVLPSPVRDFLYNVAGINSVTLGDVDSAAREEYEKDWS